MTNNFEKMMESMMEKYMEQMMAKTMEKMFSSMMPQETPAEVTKPKGSNTLSREDFLALVEESEPVATPTELDFMVVGKTAKYTGYVPSDVWTVNHLAITKNWNGRWSSKNKGYIFDSTANLRHFLANYKIKTELTDADKEAVKQYKADAAKRKAEYYAKLAGK